MNDSFKILAVRILDGCASHIRKILKTETTYFFYNEYECDSNPKLIRRKKDAKLNETPADFFRLSPKQSINISLSAIVGKNGDGKSSLVEIVIRILNNFSYAVGFLQDHSGLLPVKGLQAILYYNINNNIYGVECKDEKVVFWSYSFVDESYSFVHEYNIESPNRDISQLKQLEHALFYTNVFNYSLYAYNSFELSKEYWDNACWINGIFHKNDGYQTPIVLNPWRENGRIDINIENHLTKQRLMSLFIDDEQENSFRKISEKQYAKSFIFKIEKESKLFSVTLRRYFRENASKNLLAIITNDLNRYSQQKQLPTKEAMQPHINFWSNIEEAISKYKFLFEKAHKILVELKSVPYGREQISNEPTDLENYIIALSKLQLGNMSINNIIEQFQVNGYHLFNYLQLQRILMVIEIIKLWEKNNLFISKTVDEKNIYIRASLYVIYKTISIFEKYTVQYNNVILQSDSHFYLFEEKHVINEIARLLNKNFDILLDDIDNKKSHITLKLRQTLNFILYNHHYQYIDFEQDISDKIIEEGNQYSFCVDFTTYKARLDTVRRTRKQLTTIELLPPPIFEVEIIIEQDDSQYPMALLSSGERQRLNSIGSIIYHLTNINSIAPRENTIKYQYINLILEEVELYFHPEYQQTYIRYLIERLSKADLGYIKGVNICFITHSPFVLSDIPKNNVLFLSDGKPVRRMQENTFGANIHTLLQNGFFLNSVPIGDFAKQKINELFGKLHKGEVTREMKKEILLVSEPFLKSQLLKLYNDILPNNEQQHYIDKLYTEIEELKKLIDNDKNRQ